VVVHRGRQRTPELPMLQRVRALVGDFVFPIHRLDRQASGCLLFATRREMAGPLSAALTAGQKEYLALVRGQWKHSEPVTVEKPMKDDNGIEKEAMTRVTGLGACAEPRCSLLRAEPFTGRYHQVRRHVRDLNHPILGDHDHGDTRVNRTWREERGLLRMALHASRLRLTLPDGSALDVRAPLPEDLFSVLINLPFFEEAAAVEPTLLLTPLPDEPLGGEEIEAELEED
jgi:tRNA pseudouridine65 synthase